MLTGSVSAAARLLHVTQPAITQTLQHAELQLGYALFTRQRNRLVATHEAQTLYPEIQRLMSQLEAVRRLSLALGRQGGVGLRILIVPSLAVRALPEALARFRKRHPEMPISVRSLHSREVAQSMALQEGDVGIVYGRITHPALHVEKLATGRLVCVSRAPEPRGRARATASTRTATVALEDVLRAPFIRIDENDPLGAMLAEQWSRHGLQKLAERSADITVQTHHIAMLLAEQGLAPAIIDSFTARASTAPALRARVIQPEVPVELSALLPQNIRSPRPVAEFLDDFRAVVAED
jgi:DNA-binding transcriptional LysR family regulator